MASAHRRRTAAAVLQQMVAAQGDGKSWNEQKKHLLKILNERAD